MDVVKCEYINIYTNNDSYNDFVAKFQVKISDFGLSRALGRGKDYYQSNFSVSLKLPIAWYVSFKI